MVGYENSLFFFVFRIDSSSACMILYGYSNQIGGENKMANKEMDLNFERDFLEDGELVFVPKVEQKQPETIEDVVVKQYRAGMTLKQITTNHGLSYGKVYEILNSKGAKLRHGRYNDSKSGKRLTTMSKLEKASIIEYYQEGFEVKEILETFNLNKHGLYSILDEANVPRRQKKQFIALDIETIQNAEIEPDMVPDDGAFKPKAAVSEPIFTVTPSSPELKIWREGTRLCITVIVNEEDLEGIEVFQYKVDTRQKATPYTPFTEEEK